MLEAILTTIALGSTIAVIMASQPYQWILERLLLTDLKPFSCSICMSFWLTILLAIVLMSPEIAIASGLSSLSAKLTENEFYNL